MSLQRIDRSLARLVSTLVEVDEDLRARERRVRQTPEDPAVWRDYLTWVERSNAKVPPELVRLLTTTARVKGHSKELLSIAHEMRTKHGGTELLAQWRGNSYVVIHPKNVTGQSSDGKPWLLGVGAGFSAIFFVVFADNESDALEIAEEEWPEDFLPEGDPRRTPETGREVVDLRTGDDEDADVEGDIDLRVLQKTRVARGTRLEPYGRDYELSDGTKVEVSG